MAVFGAADLPSLCAHLCGEPDGRHTPIAAPSLTADRGSASAPDMADVIGQQGARRALEVAAAGGHHVLTCSQLNLGSRDSSFTFIPWTGTLRFCSEQEIYRESELALACPEHKPLLEIASTNQLLGC